MARKTGTGRTLVDAPTMTSGHGLLWNGTAWADADLTTQPQLDAALNRIAAGDRVASAAAARVAYEDAAVFNEQWPNLTAWTQTNSNDLALSSGKVINGPGAGNSAVRALPVGTTGKFRALATVNHPKTGGGSGVLIGPSTSSDPSSLASITAIGFNPTSTDNNIFGYYGSNAVVIGTQYLAAGTYIIVIVGDEAGVSFEITNAARTVYASFYRTRAQVGTITNLFIYNDSDQTTCWIGPIGARQSLATIAPRTGVEGVAHTASSVKEPAGDGIFVELPATYDSRVGAPVVLWSHGFGWTEQETILNAGPVALAKALLDAGFIVAGTNNGGDTWGNQTAKDKILALYRYVRDHYAIGPVILAGQSLGGLPTMNVLAERKVPCAGVMLFEPNLNLQWNRDTAAIWSDATFGPSLRTAYGAASDGSDWAAKTTGFDPMLRPAPDFRGVPVLLASSPGDTLVTKANHADLMAAKLAGKVRELDVITTSGVHNATTQFPTVEPVAFAQRCVAA